MFLLYTHVSYMESCDKCLTNAIAIDAELGKRCGVAVGVIRSF
jgi:hypothetical protein